MDKVELTYIGRGQLCLARGFSYRLVGFLQGQREGGRDVRDIVGTGRRMNVNLRSMLYEMMVGLFSEINIRAEYYSIHAQCKLDLNSSKCASL